MPSQTNEKALEDCIETALINSGYQKGNPTDFNREFAIDTAKLWQFLETTQPDELAKLKDHHNWQRLILERLNRKILKDGVISVLKKGISLDNAHLTLLNSLPYNDLNPQIKADFQQNIFSITRQVYYSQKTQQSIDIVLFINGIAIATNLRGYHSGDSTQDPLDDIIQAFNERYFSGWDATPEEQRVKFQNIISHVRNNPQYQAQVVNNPDEQNRNIALEEIIKQAVNAERRRELDLYRCYASDPEFKRAFDQIIITFLMNNRDAS